MTPNIYHHSQCFRTFSLPHDLGHDHAAGLDWAQFAHTLAHTSMTYRHRVQARSERPVSPSFRASPAEGAPLGHVHSVACGTPGEFLARELEPLYDLSIAAALIPCSLQRLKNFLKYQRRRHLFPGRYRIDPARRRIRLLYAREIHAARRQILKRWRFGVLVP